MPAAAAPVPVRAGAVVVSYHPELAGLEQLVAAIAPQVDVVWVVDNGSPAPTCRALETLCARHGAELVLYGANRGIAAAHNEGLHRGLARGLDAVVLFDQDSVPAEDLVSRLVAASQTHGGGRVAAAGPVWVDERSGRRGAFHRVRGGRIVSVPADPAQAAQPVDFLISSGTLVWLAAVRAIGPMREDLFIDHVDTEWCLRAGHAGWQLLGVPGAVIRHALGDATRRVWLGRWREVALHSPVRNYYEVRNTLLLLRAPGADANWWLAHGVRLLQLLVFYGLLVAPRWQRTHLMLRGLADGLRGRGGPLV